MVNLPLITGLLAAISAVEPTYDNRARIRTENGHLQLYVADGRNISFRTGRNGAILFNDADITWTLQLMQNASAELTNLRSRDLASLSRQQAETSARLDAEIDLNYNQRIVLLEQSLANVSNVVGQNSPAGGGSLRQLRRKVRTLENNLQQMSNTLAIDDCASSPCRNGATCIDSYNSFRCLCPANFEGPTCESDVDECASLRGTDLGCQNGATCINSHGSYRCNCAAGWYGVHCTQRSDGCQSGTNEQICGHGVCISQPGQGRSYICLCEQGWTKDAINGGCTVDINECDNAIPICSTNPRVQCVNLPGSFTCGPCPSGYTGNGHYCVDVDECQINNGGCSLNPRVQCTNTIGSRQCGPCPPGYQGDGVYCQFVGMCSVNNGGCHPAAFCYDNPAISSSYVSCQCRPGFTGSGFGPSGCVPASSGGGGSSGTSTSGGGGMVITDPCSPNPCQFGTCSAGANGAFLCSCQPGYVGQLCQIPVDPCTSSPCRNGATCAVVGPSRQFRCICPADFTGDYCETQVQACGGFLDATNGTLSYPSNDGAQYPHMASCAWLITTTPGRVLNVTFTRFHLEGSSDCRFDWLQIHDGADTASRTIGRYCGNSISFDQSSSLMSSHNQLFFWFRSDHSAAGQGFELTWNTVDPVCGGQVRQSTHGAINSPGYPGRYPVSRDCMWVVSAPPGKRLQLMFATLQLEHHPNCSYDFLEIRDGPLETDPLLGKFCSTSNPPPVTTSGPYALIYFHSDQLSTDNGFHITYAAVNGIPGCGGLLTSPVGTMSSPNHPDTYDNNLNCEWVIRSTPDERIRLTFTALTLENSRNCVFDYVEVREGGAPDSPLIGRFCGARNDLPPAITSQGNQLFVKFRSDYSVGHSGFRARYETVCGGSFSSPSGVLQSPNYPSPYPGNKQCVYVVGLDPGKAVQLNFLTFDVEGSANCRFDYVEVRDGDSANSTLIGRFCGPSNQMPATILSTHNYLWLKFVTDASVHNGGFLANYSSVDVGCGGIFTSPQGILTSPRHPETYPHRSACRWIIRAPPGKVIRLQWLTFALESHPNCRFDYVEVYDNTTVPGTGGLVGRYCGTALPPSITSMEGTLTVVFKTDSSISADGFSASYITLNSSSFCGGTYFTETGLISSPGYPSGYPPSTDCTWIIQAPLNRQVLLNVTDFDLENHTSCVHDYLELRNGGSATAPLIGKFCGRNIPRSVPSHSHLMFVRFVSDFSVSGRGFRLWWDATSTGCGGVLSSPSGSLTSPGYPSTYGRNAECFWRIEVSQGSKVLFAFSDMDMESQMQSCNFDFVEVRNGRDRRAPLIGRYCNSYSLVPIVSKDSSLYIKFKSDYHLSGRGFSARYETLCNTEVRGLSGVIESPNFPRPYPHDRNCTWVIVAPQGNRVAVAFSHFEVEDHPGGNCTFDFVEIRQSNGTLGRFCGLSLPPEVTSTQSRVTVQFLSDLSVAHNGFRLEWRTIGCGGRLTKPSGSISSPNYPQTYPVATDCIWEIETEPGTRVELTVSNFDIESATGCNFDFLRIHGGQDESAPELTTLCHKQEHPVVVTSSGNRMFIHFHSDVSIRGRGFLASFNTVPQGCGGVFRSPTGIINSPNYPNKYDDHSDCTWLIQVPTNHLVELNWLDFDVEQYINCTYDYVAVYDGVSVDDPELGTFCGSSLPNPQVIRSTSNQMYIRLKADGSHAGRGFRANYTTGCGARITVEDFGELTSSNFLYPYQRSLNCSWILSAANPTDRVALTFTHMDIYNDVVSPSADSSGALLPGNTNCTLDFVQVRDGDDADAPLIGTYCLTRVPPHITSQGSALYVNMIGTRRLGAGFRASYSLVGQGCGGNLTSEHGSLTSPSYPGSYPLSTECVWTISASAGNRVLVSFRQFQIQESEFCNGDYLEIRSNNGGGELIGHYCGNQIPTNITAANKLWIKFRSDEDGTAAGFLVDYSLLHGNELSGSRGEIASPLYPHTYVLRGEYTWRVTVDAERRVRIYFPHFSVERDPDSGACISSLLVYDGYDDDAPLLAQLCGDRRPNRIFTTGNVVFIRFVSRYINEGSSFRLIWDSVGYAPPSFPGQPTINRTTCGGDLYISERNVTVIRSPGFPNGYANNLFCSWSLSTDPHFRISVQFNTLDFEGGSCLFDRLELFEPPAETVAGFRFLGRFCRRDQRGTVVNSNRNEMRIVFRTDSSQNATGFQLTARAACGGILTGPRGLIKSPQYPSSYPPSTTCEWDIRVRPGRTIRARFDNLQIASDPPECAQDYVVLRNGDSVDSPVLAGGRICGSSVPAAVTTSGNRMHVRFVSDGTSTVSAGFQLRFEEVGMSCGDRILLTDDVNDAVISSPNYPSTPPAHAECEWVILAPAGHSVQMDITDTFDITRQYGCRTAALEVRDGGTLNSRLLGRYCGSNPPGSIYSRGNSLYIRYFNNVQNPSVGFRARVSIARCGGTLVIQRNGVITSPNYPSTYDPNSRCLWNIRGPVGHSLNFQFTQFDLPTSSNCSRVDFVQIREQNATNDGVRGTYCGSTAPEVLTTYSNEADVLFQSGSRVYNRQGFRLAFNASAEGCGGELDGPTGIIRSPGYPTAYPHGRICMWKIRGPPGRRITLTFDDFALEEARRTYGNRTVCLDFVYAINGPDMHGPALFTNPQQCGSTLPEPVQSSGSDMLLLFRTDGSVTHRGFSAHYDTDAPAFCGGDLTETSGSFTSPGLTDNTGNYTHSLLCEWRLDLASAVNSSAVFTINMMDIEGPVQNGGCAFDALEFYSGTSRLPFGQFCGNQTAGTVVINPYPTTMIRFRTDASVHSVGFNVSYKMSGCGGIIRSPQNLTSPNFPSYYGTGIDCVWAVDLSEFGQQVQVTFNDLQLDSEDCTQDYLSILNGRLPSSPELGRFCGSTKPAVIRSQSSFLWIRFHSDGIAGSSRGFSMEIQGLTSGCGGIFHSKTGMLTSPNYPSQYGAGMECEWEIRLEPGYKIIATFSDRFDIENSTGCVNDFVELFDQTDDQTWISLGKYCGKQLPAVITSSAENMKILFRSNSANQGDGFRLRWKLACGGSYTAPSGTIMSPGYPLAYGNNLVCNYTITTGADTYIIATFDEPFNIEDQSLCMHDKLSAYQGNRTSSQILGRYCGSRTPQPIVSKAALFLQFRTDSSISRAGFRINYQTQECGGRITSPTEIRSPAHPDNYHNNLNCTWTIQAPVDRVIDIKFQSLTLEGHRNCRFDYVAVYEGSFINETQMARKLCGNFSFQLPRIKTRGSSALIQFRSDWSDSYGGFSAAVRFTSGERQGCGGIVNLTETSQLQLRAPDVAINPRNDRIEGELDCQWTVLTVPGKVIRFQLTQIDMAASTASGNCDDDYLELRDGPGTGSSLIGRFCGSTSPPSLVGSNNIMSVRLVTGTSNRRANFAASVSYQEPPCGSSSRLDATEAARQLTSPGYPVVPAGNLRCRWLIDGNGTAVQLRFQQLSLGQTTNGQCGSDRLEIEDIIDSRLAPQSNNNLVLNGEGVNLVALDQRRVIIQREFGQRLTFCGSRLPHDVISSGGSIAATLITGSEPQGTGFQLQYSVASCNRTYEGMEGRIVSPRWPGVFRSGDYCQMSIQSPVNTTISIYFNFFRLQNSNNCTASSLDIRDGETSTAPLLASLCGSSLPDSVYSTGNRLWLRFRPARVPLRGYDLTYTSTSQGPGCGGAVFNSRGSVTSPNYPGNANRTTDCRWELSVPVGMIIKIEFTVFTFGPAESCDSNYVELFDVQTNGAAETFRSRFCGTDRPAVYLGTTNGATIRYVTSVNNTGPGWRAAFEAATLP